MDYPAGRESTMTAYNYNRLGPITVRPFSSHHDKDFGMHKNMG